MSPCMPEVNTNVNVNLDPGSRYTVWVTGPGTHSLLAPAACRTPPRSMPDPTYFHTPPAKACQTELEAVALPCRARQAELQAVAQRVGPVCPSWRLWRYRVGPARPSCRLWHYRVGQAAGLTTT